VASCLVVQHHDVERPFKIADALLRAGVEVQVTKVFAGDMVTLGDHHSGVVVMGGPMSAHSDEGFVSRKAEIALLAEAVGRDLPVLGVFRVSARLE